MCPIKGLTDTGTQQFGSGLPRIATLHKGEEKTDPRRPGRDLNHFRVEFEDQFEYLRSIWQDLYGTQPTSFKRVFLAQPTVDEAFACWKEEWTAIAMLHRCDGEFQVRHYNAEAAMYMTTKIPCAASSNPGCKCKPTGRLNLLFVDFIEESGILGYVAVTTHSLHDIMSLTRYLNDIQRVYGGLMGVPFVFGRAEREVSTPKPNGKPGERIKVKKSLLHLHVGSDFTQQVILPILSGAIQPPQGFMLNGQTATALPAPEVDINAAKARLGAGGGQARRIGGLPVDENGVVVVTQPAQKSADHWTSKSEQVVKLTAWAKGRFAMNEVDVVQALSVTEVIEKVVDFNGTEKEAMAAVVAWHCNYDPDAMSSVTSNPTIFPDEGVGFDVYELACDLSEVVTSAAEG